jgi:hypothetical protein
MAKKVKPGGLLAFSSQNKLAHKYSYKISFKNKVFKEFFEPFIYSKNNVLGGVHLLDLIQNLSLAKQRT